MNRGFLTVTTQDRVPDLVRFLPPLLKFNDYPVLVVTAKDKLDAHRKKAMSGLLSPFDSTVLIDTDILINGNLDYLFQVAEQGRIGILWEDKVPVYNSGVVAIPGPLKKELCEVWLRLYDDYMKVPVNRFRGTYDQCILNDVLHMDRFKNSIQPLPPEYNYILKFSTPEQEASDFPNIKVFHFLHDNSELVKSFRSYKIWAGGPYNSP